MARCGMQRDPRLPFEAGVRRYRASTGIEVGGEMNLVTAFIRPFKLDEVRVALNALGIRGLTVTEVRGSFGEGPEIGVPAQDGGAEALFPKLKLEIVVDQVAAEAVLEVIRHAAEDERTGGGGVFYYPIDELVRIRTGETGPDAL